MQKCLLAGLLMIFVGCAPAARPGPTNAIELAAFQQRVALSSGVAYFKGPALRSKPILESLIDLHRRGVRVIALFERGAERGNGSLVDELANRLSGTRSTVLLATDATKIPAFMQTSAGTYRGDGLVKDKGVITVSTDAAANETDLAQFEAVSRQVYVP